MSFHHRNLRPNLTPMIDVVFLLLLFFVLSTQFSNSEMTWVETSALSGGNAAKEAFLLLEITEKGILLEGRDVNKEELTDRVQGFDGHIALRANEGVDVQSLIGFQAELLDMGAQRVILVERR